MCSLFGLIDHGKVLATREKNRILNTLARECECRGTDATGIAYHFNGQMRIYKRPLPAHRMKLHIPNGVNVVMGHTRMTTQGSEKRNYNNHPFPGCCGGNAFALAHNGVLWNDRELQADLSKTNIQTDSYVAVQLLEKQGALDFSSLKAMAETVEGSFVFTVLDAQNTVWVVKGDNPFVLYHYNGFTLYASTEAILRRIAKRLRFGLPNGISEPEEGKILKSTGRITTGSFIPYHTCQHWWRYRPYYDPIGVERTTGTCDLTDAAKSMGISTAGLWLFATGG